MYLDFFIKLHLDSDMYNKIEISTYHCIIISNYSYKMTREQTESVEKSTQVDRKVYQCDDLVNRWRCQ